MALIDKMRVLRDNIRFDIYKLMYDYKNPLTQKDFNFNKIKHIVISKVDGKLGDTEVLSPFFLSIKKNCPHIKISVITLENLKDVYKDCIKVYNTVVSPQKRPNYEQVKEFCKDIKKVGPCDLLICLDEKIRPREFYLFKELKPSFIAGVNTSLKCMNVHIEINPQEHMSHALNSLLLKGGINDIETSYVPFIKDDLVKKYKDLFKDSKVVGFTPYGAGGARKLSLQTQIAMLNYIKEHSSYNVALLLPPKEDELRLKLEEILEIRCVKLPQMMDVIELGSIIASLDAMISVDTGNLHLCCAFDMPLFSMHPSKAYIKIWGPPHDKVDAVKFYKDNTDITDFKYCDLKDSFESFVNKYLV